MFEKSKCVKRGRLLSCIGTLNPLLNVWNRVRPLVSVSSLKGGSGLLFSHLLKDASLLLLLSESEGSSNSIGLLSVSSGYQFTSSWLSKILLSQSLWGSNNSLVVLVSQSVATLASGRNRWDQRLNLFDSSLWIVSSSTQFLGILFGCVFKSESVSDRRRTSLFISGWCCPIH
jgi:hypothetical protein